MEAEILFSLVASVFGGSMVSAITHVSNRGRIKAEIAKLEAETERTRAETRALLAPSLPPSEGHALPPSEGRAGLPPGWTVDGRWLDGYEISIDRTVAHTGSSSALIAALPGARGFATLMQKAAPHGMRGQRIRMSAYVKVEDVEWALLWMRVDDPDGLILSFDNMEDRPILGTSDWCEHVIVLDVPANGAWILFGALLSKRGRLWVDDFSFEPVDESVPVTGSAEDASYHSRSPENLDFED